MHRPPLRALVVLLASSSPFAALAVPPSHPCAVEDDAARRLACYDAAFPRPAGAADAVGARPGAGAAAASAGRTDAEFGRPPERVRPSAKPAEPRELRGIVAAVGRTPSGKLIVTLDSGQVWVQTDVASSEAVKPGADVRIEKAMLGSFLLLAPDRSAIRVRRVQ